jgi:hypothetical protein
MRKIVIATDVIHVVDQYGNYHKMRWSDVDTFIGNSTSLSNVLTGTTTLTSPAATDLSVSDSLYAANAVVDSLYATKTVSPNITDGTATLTGGAFTGLTGVLGNWVTYVDSINVVDSTLYVYTNGYRGSVSLSKQ